MNGIGDFQYVVSAGAEGADGDGGEKGGKGGKLGARAEQIDATSRGGMATQQTGMRINSSPLLPRLFPNISTAARTYANWLA